MKLDSAGIRIAGEFKSVCIRGDGGRRFLKPVRFLLLGQTEPMKATASAASQNNSTVIESSPISKAAVNEMRRNLMHA